MDKLSYDLIEKICYNLSLDDLLNFSGVNKEMHNFLDNLFFINLAIKFFNKNFWVKATLRPAIKSNPLSSMKLELIRIEKFQKALDSLNQSRWTEKDFYNYWILD